jgi:Uma2 family endonuclease
MHTPLLEGPFTVADYHRLAEVGILGEDDRVELLDGQVVVMSPIGPRHAGCVDRLNRLLSRLVGDLAIVRVQNPIVLSPRTEPEPDLSLLSPPIERYSAAHPRPTDVMLVIEVAESSLAYDRDVKLPRYAAAGIPEVWLVNLEAERVEVHRQPSPSGYQETFHAVRGDTLTVDNLMRAEIPISPILG